MSHARVPPKLQSYDMRIYLSLCPNDITRELRGLIYVLLYTPIRRLAGWLAYTNSWSRVDKEWYRVKIVHHCVEFHHGKTLAGSAWQ